MKKNLWVETPQPTDDEIQAEIDAFLARGGEIIDMTHYTDKKNSKTAVRIGPTSVKLREAANK